MELVDDVKEVLVSAVSMCDVFKGLQARNIAVNFVGIHSEVWVSRGWDIVKLSEDMGNAVFKYAGCFRCLDRQIGKCQGVLADVKR